MDRIEEKEDIRFQILVGRLQTTYSGADGDDKFQILVGRLSTRQVPATAWNLMKKFQILVGRLQTTFRWQILVALRCYGFKSS